MQRDVRRPRSKDFVSHFTFIPSGNHSIQEVFKMGLQVRNKADFVAVIVENQFSIMTLKYQNSNTPEIFFPLYNEYNRWVDFKRIEKRSVLGHLNF